MKGLNWFRRQTKGPDPGRLVLRRTLGADRVVYRIEHQTTAGARTIAWPPDDLPGGCQPLDDRDGLAVELLTELCPEGLVERSGDGFELLFKSVVEVDEDLAGLLGLRTEPGWFLELGLRGRVGTGTSDVSRRWTTPGGAFDPPFEEVQCGLVDRKRGRLHVVPRDLARIAALAMRGHDGSPHGEYAFLAELQHAAAPINTLKLRLDPQLTRETYVAPERLAIELEPQDNGGIRLKPRLAGVPADLSFKLEAEERIGAQVVVRGPSDPRRRVRLAIAAPVREAFEQVQSAKDIAPEDVQRFVDDPRGFLAAKGAADATLDLNDVPSQLADLDLNRFDQRVVGLSEDEPDTRRLLAAQHSTDWFGGDAPSDAEAAAEAAEPPTEREAGRSPRLVTADNDEELQFDAPTNAALRAVAETLSPPTSFAGTLRAFQREGFAWLRQLDAAAELGTVGGLLADDMGLGKTVQIIAHLARLRDENRLRPALLVAPSAVVINWREEIARFCPAIRWVTVHTGPGRARDLESLGRSEVILTTYGTLVSDQLILGQLELSLLVCDEAQYIKNYTTKRARACRAMNARVRVALSATPVENSLDELWSIMDFCQPGLLGAFPEFCSRYADPIGAGNGDRASVAAQELFERLGDHYLRRTKHTLMRTSEGAAALDLPGKEERVRELTMPDEQRESYVDVLRTLDITSALGRLKRLFLVSVHPALASGEFDSAFEDARRDPDTFIRRSAKLAFVFDELEHVRSKAERAVVFVHRRGVQQLIRTLLRQRFDISANIVNGSVSSHERLSLVRAFNATPGFEVLVLSPLAAGVGLNITGANHVFHLMRLWNPAKENQATDRCYRIGQTRPVNVHVPLAVGHAGEEERRGDSEFGRRIPTVDYRLNELLERKRRVAEHVIRPSVQQSISWKELENCLDHEEPLPSTEPPADPSAISHPRYQGIVRTVVGSGLPHPVSDYVLNDDTGTYMATLDIAWPNARVAVVSERRPEHRQRALDAGWKCFRYPAIPDVVVIRLRTALGR